MIPDGEKFGEVMLRPGQVAYMDTFNTVHLLGSAFTAQDMNYVERYELWAKFQALADIVDPGDYETYQQNKTRTIITNFDTKEN